MVGEHDAILTPALERPGGNRHESPPAHEHVVDAPAIRTAWTNRRSSLLSLIRSCPRSVAACFGATRIAFACPARPERKNPWCDRVTHVERGPGQSGGRATASKWCIPDQLSIRATAQTGSSWRQTTSGPSSVTSSIIRLR